MLVDLLSAIGGLLRVKDCADVDNAVFKLHYRITTSILLTFCILVTAKGLVGDPIKCVFGEDKRINSDVVNTYCWIHTTFTLPKYLHNSVGRGSAIAYPGVGTYQGGDDQIFHAYYQWVPFTLFLQGIMFYAPHWLWKAWEGRRLDSMIMGLSNPVISKEEKHEKIKLLANYLIISMRRHNLYLMKYFICEVVNFINCFFHMWFLDHFLGGLFFNVGFKVLDFINLNQEDRTDPLIVAFPRVTKCNFHIFGPSGTLENLDFMCVLALNVLNEKIYLFLWFWFIFLSIVSGLGIAYRVVIYCLPFIRISLLLKKAKLTTKRSASVLSKHLEIGDCFLLHLLSKNIDIIAFNDLMKEIYYKLLEKEEPSDDIEMASTDTRNIEECCAFVDGPSNV